MSEVIYNLIWERRRQFRSWLVRPRLIGSDT